MTLLICMVMCFASLCTALAIVSPFPQARTIDDVALELEGNPRCSAREEAMQHCILYTTEEGESQEGPGYPIQPRKVDPRGGVRVKRVTVLAVISWVSLVMATVSACFLLYDVVAHGFWFRGSVLPLALIIAFPIFSTYAERKIDLRDL